MHEKVTEDDPNVWSTHIGNPDEALGSWHQHGVVLAVVTVWGMNQQMEDLSVSPPFCMSNFPIYFFKKTNKSFKKVQNLMFSSFFLLILANVRLLSKICIKSELKDELITMLPVLKFMQFFLIY